MNASLFNRIGGETAVKATVSKMYEKILADPELSPFFEHINMDMLHNSQTMFVTYAFGGASNYTGKSMRAAHKDAVSHGLSDRHFDLVAGHLKAAMEELHVPEILITEALTIVGSTRNDVLNK